MCIKIAFWLCIAGDFHPYLFLYLRKNAQFYIYSCNSERPTNWSRQNEQNRQKCAFFRSTRNSSLAHSCTFVCACIFKNVQFFYSKYSTCAVLFMDSKACLSVKCSCRFTEHFLVEELKRSVKCHCHFFMPSVCFFFLTRMVIKELQNHVRLSCSYMGSVGVCCIVLNFSMKDHLWRQLRRSHTNIVAKFEHCFYHYPRFGWFSSFIFHRRHWNGSICSNNCEKLLSSQNLHASQTRRPVHARDNNKKSSIASTNDSFLSHATKNGFNGIT